MNTWNQEN